MRALSAAQQKVFESGAAAVHFRVSVKDVGGTYRDLSTFPGFDFTVSADFEAQLDGRVTSANVSLVRDVEKLSAAPLMAASKLNYGGELLAVGRAIKIEGTYCAVDTAVPAAGEWLNVFEGAIDSIDWAKNPITIQARDGNGALQDRFVESEKVYAFIPEIAGAFIYKPGEVYALGDFVIPSDTKRNGHYFKVTTAGTSGAIEPSWPTSGTVTSGGVTFTRWGATSTAGRPSEDVIQAVINDWAAGSLYTPTSPSFTIRPYKQSRGPVLDAIETIAEQRGWDVRQKWDGSAWRPTYSGPDRAPTTVAQTFAPSRYETISKIASDLSRVRNVIRVIYSDSADLDAQKRPKRKSVTVTDSASVTKYGRRYYEIAEAATSHINTSIEALALANAVLADLAEPLVGVVVEVAPWFPFAEISDYYRLAANGVHFDADQDLAVIAVRHSLSASGKSATTLTLSGKPAVRRDVWLDYESREDTTPPHATDLFNADPPTATAEKVVGGIRVNITAIRDKHTRWEGNEVHVDTNPAFEPSSSTLKARVTGDQVVIPDLLPGTPYYVRLVPYGFNADQPVRALPGPPIPVTAGHLHGRHVWPYLDLTKRPLNGGFESPGTLGVAPDCWDTDAGTFGTDWTTHNAETYRGSVAAKFLTTAVAAAIRSSWVPVFELEAYTLSLAIQKIGSPAAGRTADVTVVWYAADQTVISGSSTSVALNALGAGWQAQTISVTAPTGARWARVVVAKSAHTDASFWLDEVRFDPPAASGGGGGVAGSVELIVTNSYAQSCLNGAFTLLHYDTTVTDTAGAWNYTTGEYTVPAAGTYLLTAYSETDATMGGDTSIALCLFVNGVQVSRFEYKSFRVATHAPQISIGGALPWVLAAGDKVKIQLYQVNTSAATYYLSGGQIGNRLYITRMR